MRKHAPVVVFAAAIALVLAGLLAPASADAKRIRAFVYLDRTQPTQSVVVEDFRVNETISDVGGVEYLWVRGPAGNFQVSLQDVRQIEVVKWLGPDTTTKVDWVRYQAKVTGTSGDVVYTGVIEVRVLRGIAGRAPWYYFPSTQSDRGSKLWRMVFGSESQPPTLPLEEKPAISPVAVPPAPGIGDAVTPAPLPTEDELFARMSLDDLNKQKPLGDVYFHYDLAAFGKNGDETLVRSAEWLKRWPTTRVRIQGQADPRGTNEYNQDLGRRRAEAVRAYLIAAGVAENRLEVFSTGEAELVCTEATEACWAKNRRAHFLFTAK